MKHCETCKHWGGPEEPDYNPIKGLGRCGLVPLMWDSGGWDDEGENWVLRPEFEGRLAFAQDASDYSAYLLTFPTFGCVQHEEKEG